jgi:hypothetical protein
MIANGAVKGIRYPWKGKSKMTGVYEEFPELTSKLRLGLTALLESRPVKHAAINFGVEDLLLAFPR